MSSLTITTDINSDLATRWSQSGGVTELTAAAALWETEGEYSQAVAALSRCAELDKKNRGYYLNRGGELAALFGDHNLAASLFSQAAGGTEDKKLSLRAEMETERAKLDLAIPPPLGSEKPDISKLWVDFSTRAAQLTKVLRQTLSQGTTHEKALALLYMAQVYERLGVSLVGNGPERDKINPIDMKLSPAVGEFYEGASIKNILEFAANDFSLAAFLIQSGEKPDWRWAGPAQDRFFTISEMIGNIELK